MVILINGVPAGGGSGGAVAPAETKLWLPGVVGGTGGQQLTYWTQFGIAYKHDKLVHAWFDLLSDGLAAFTGNWLLMTGLPYPISSQHSSAVSNKMGQANGMSTTFTEVGVMAYSPDVNQLRIIGRSSSGTIGYLPPTALTDPTGFAFQGWISYLTD